MNQSNPRILVIDDEQGLRDMLVYGLSRRGYAVTTAANGVEAVAIAKNQAFDIALCDLMMPEMSGVETLIALKGGDSRIKVVMATGQCTLENVVESMKAGAFGCIGKPYGMDELCGLLAKALHGAVRS
jgi:DNA-binding NtrC family response regulator